MSVVLSPIGGAGWQFFGGNTANSAPNVPLAGGLLNIYAAGTTTPVTTYTSSTGGTPNTNPVVLDSTGRPATEIWLTAGASYRFVLMDAASNILPDGTWDNVPGINDVAGSGGNMTWLGAWNSGTAYTVNNVVQNGGVTYICILGNTNQAPPNGTYWTVLAGGGSSGTINYQNFTATAGQTVFALAWTYSLAINQLQIRRNGAWLNIGSDYTETSVSSFTLNTGAFAGDTISAITFSGAGATGPTGATGATGGTGPIPQNSQSGPYTLVIGDAGYHIYHPSADTTARTWTIPANASVAFPIGTAVTFVNDTSAGVITLQITTDTLVWMPTGGTGTRTLAANASATALKVTATRWVLTGVGVT